jgi:hypothetical protein
MKVTIKEMIQEKNPSKNCIIPFTCFDKSRISEVFQLAAMCATSHMPPFLVDNLQWELE